jgi:carboxyl-terminal processing protease
MAEAAVRGMIEALNDPYTVYLPPEALDDFERSVRGSFSGIGAEVTTAPGRLTIVTPLEDSPAWEAGVMAGDTILEIDGASTLDMDIREAVDRLTGERGTDVTIKVRRESGEEKQITITRDLIEIQTVRGFRRGADQHFDFMLDHANKVGYIRITQFSDPTVAAFQDALATLQEQGARAIILDLRFDPGGLLSAAVQISDMFLTGGQTIVSIKGRSVPEKVHQSTDQTLMPDIPLVVIANEASASAAEIVAGALKDNDRALVVGTRTFGKGSVQQVRMLETEQGALKITNAYWHIPSGRIIHRREDSDTWGVDPSPGAYVPMTIEQREEMLELRRESDVLRADNGAASDQAITPELIDEQLKDPQLAAALRAALGRLQTGEWPAVGSDRDVEALVQQQRKAELERRRDLLQRSLAEVQEKLDELKLTRGEIQDQVQQTETQILVEEQVEEQQLETVPAE